MNRRWAYVCGFILLCPAIIHSAAELPRRRSDVDLLVNNLRDNHFEQALEVAQRIVPEMGVDTLMRILEGKINFFNESSSKFFDWMQEKRQSECERIEKMRAVHPGEQEREHVVAPFPAPAESYESLREGIIENYFKGKKFESSNALIEKIKAQYGTRGLERLYNDLEENARYDLGLRKLRERLLYDIQAGKAVQVPRQVVQPVQKRDRKSTV